MKKRDYAGGSQKDVAGNSLDAAGGRQERESRQLRRTGLHQASIRVMSIDVVQPSEPNRPCKTYLTRPTFSYTNAAIRAGWLNNFVDFTIGSGGQKIVGQVSFVPIP